MPTQTSLLNPGNQFCCPKSEANQLHMQHHATQDHFQFIGCLSCFFLIQGLRATFWLLNFLNVNGSSLHPSTSVSTVYSKTSEPGKNHGNIHSAFQFKENLQRECFYGGRRRCPDTWIFHGETEVAQLAIEGRVKLSLHHWLRCRHTTHSADFVHVLGGHRDSFCICAAVGTQQTRQIRVKINQGRRTLLHPLHSTYQGGSEDT